MKQKLFALVRRKNPERENDVRSTYYETASVRFGIAQVVLFLALLAFVILSLLNNRELVTYENFYYFFKDLNAVNLDLYDADTVNYPTDEIQSFTLYRKGLAVGGNNSVSIFTQSGRQLVSASVSYRNPVAIGSGKYLLVFDLGGNGYSLYNSYSQIHSGNTDDPIAAGAISPSGSFAIATRSEQDTLSTVSLYNDRFTLVNRYKKSGYVMDLSINDKGNLLAILLSDVSGGQYETSVFLYVPGESTHKASVMLESGLGISCNFTSSASLAVLSEKGIDYISYSGARSHVSDFGTKRILAADASSDGLAVCLTGESRLDPNQLLVFDKNGRQLYKASGMRNFTSLSRVGKTLYCLSDGMIERLNLSSGNWESMPHVTNETTLLALGGDSFLLCSSQKAKILTFRAE